MGFQNPEAFYLLILILPLGYVMWSSRRHNQKVISRFHGFEPGKFKSLARSCFIFLLVTSLITVISRPYSRLQRTADFLFLVDISRSMQARKSCTQPSYLDRTKDIMRSVISSIPEGRFGIFVFERLAFPITHMTYDHTYLDSVVEYAIYDGLIFDRTGSRLGNALTALAEKKIKLPDVYKNVNTVILLSDGNLKGDYIRELEEPIKKVTESGLSIVSVGIGNSDPTPIPIKEDGSCVDKFIVKEGTLITMGLQSDSLKYVSQSTSGKYYGEGELTPLITHLRDNSLKDTLINADITQRQRTDLSWIFLLISSISLFGYMWLDLNLGTKLFRKKHI
jgi:hypothetical protein